MTGSVYTALGGHDSVVALVDGLYERLVQDQTVMHHFDPARLSSLKEAQIRWFTACLSGQDLPSDLAEAHARLRITDEQVAAVVGHLEAVLVERRVDHRLRRSVVSVVTRLWYARLF